MSTNFLEARKRRHRPRDRGRARRLAVLQRDLVWLRTRINWRTDAQVQRWIAQVEAAMAAIRRDDQ